MLLTIYNHIIWLLQLIFTNKRFYLAKIGAALIATTNMPSFEVNIEYIGLHFTYNNVLSDFFNFVALFIGAFLIYMDTYKINKNARSASKVFIRGMMGSNSFPEEIIDKYEKPLTREPVILGIMESENMDTYKNKAIELFNAEQKVGIYERFIFNDNCTKIYLGGRARIPFLVAYGTRFKNAGAQIVYYDQLHRNTKWSLLNEVSHSISIEKENDINGLTSNSSGEIGLAVSFTTQILETQLPNSLQNHTLFIKPNCTQETNLIKNQENLQAIGQEIKKIIETLHKKNQNITKIHLFLAIQVSLAIEIGRNYQEGMHAEWVVHNFEPSSGGYAWSINISKDSILSNEAL